MANASKDTEHLEVALQSHPFAVAIELAKVAVDGQPRQFGPFPVAYGPVEDALLVPAYKSILEKRSHVVSDRPVNGVLKVEHSRIGVGQHQVARHEIAMHVSSGLGQVVCEDKAEHRFQGLPLANVQLEAEVALQVPLGKQIEFASQQGFIVERQHALAAGQLPADQRIGCIAEQCIGIVVV